MLSKQKLTIMRIIDTLEYATANDIKVVFEKDEQIIGNVHMQLSRLIEDGLVKRIEKSYRLTEKGRNILNFKEVKETSPTLTFSEERVKEFFKFASSDGILDKLTELVSPHILGLNMVKLSSLLTIISLDDEKTCKNRINLLLKGESGTGKSEIIKWCHDNLWGVFSDTNTRKTGFRGGALGYQYKPGLLQMANNSVLYIDEIDKFEPKDLDALLSALSYGKVFINLDKVSKETDTYVRCISTCNNEKRLKEELINRFDLVIEVKNLSEKERESIIFKKTNDWNRKSDSPDSTFVIDYIKYASKFPTSLPEDREEISNILIEEFSRGKLRGRSVRKIESVYRIALALGRLKLKSIISTEEIKEAINLLNESKY
ncbi:hypothetical protein DRN69_00645 [Candidatus Pacearchaeota archaeon]|nr:MAG: hypothetical protein DRN69_00645 [Candidatus Pacearchaeota archaeon]